ncbi:hypothetical protein EGW08_017256 [Elysia chlorotica]|uniref:RNase H type-1 domain-containing protein n=1 Tax=Elysia chlorotica TaxID=188477 RepID=A0A433T0B7_ELYCH|nr:hypothetical protein EGW08_017256 [Elysia chlorotica]
MSQTEVHVTAGRVAGDCSRLIADTSSNDSTVMIRTQVKSFKSEFTGYVELGNAEMPVYRLIQYQKRQRVLYLRHGALFHALKSSKNKDLNDLTSALTSLSQTHTIALQWIPSHCNVFGNETADLLAKKAAALQQNDYTTTYSEAKTIIHAQQHEEWLQEHPNHVQNDAYHALTRAEQVVIFRLRTGHNRLNHHLYTKLHIGTSDQCTCQTGGQTVIHVLQHCPMYENLRNLM